MLRWAYAITTVPERRSNELPRTLASLRNAGFTDPFLFVDGEPDPVSWREEFSLEVTCRYPGVRVAGHWILSLYELYIRKPGAERYAMFQDDLIACANLKDYLEQCKYPEDGYWNLYTWPHNEQLVEDGKQGWFLSNQKGLGALALVFNRQAVNELLASAKMIETPQDRQRGHLAIDGTISKAFKKFGRKEYVHNPSLVQHIGVKSTIGNRPKEVSKTFPGETKNAATFFDPIIPPH